MKIKKPYFISSLFITNLRNLLIMVLIAGSFGAFSSWINIDLATAQSSDNTIYFPDVNLSDSKTNQIASFNLEFILFKNNDNGNDNNTDFVRVMESGFSLEAPFAKLTEGEKYTINPLNEDDIPFINATLKIANVQYMDPTSEIEEIDIQDPEQMTLGSLVDLGNQAIGSNGFILPANITPGNYIMYVYLQYPHGITGVFSNFVTIIK